MHTEAALFAVFISCLSAQFVPRFPYYSPQEFLLDYVDASSSAVLSPSLNYDLPIAEQKPRQHAPRMLALRDLPTFDSPVGGDKFDEKERQPGVRPKFTGGFLKGHEVVAAPVKESVRKAEQIRFQGPVTNPAATFLAGSHFEKLSDPKCRMMNCAGPVPNDGSVSTADLPAARGSACSQVLVPINGCSGGAGYPMAMVCSVCCECTQPLISELLKTATRYQRPLYN